MSAVDESVNRQLTELPRLSLGEGQLGASGREFKRLPPSIDRIQTRRLLLGQVLARGSGSGRQRPPASRGVPSA